jgi:hypothetical protein
MSRDDLGNRMKMYEEAWANGPPDRDGVLHGYDPICIRLDGRAFHT